MSSDQTRREQRIRDRAEEDVRMQRIPNSGYDPRTKDHFIYTEAVNKASGS